MSATSCEKKALHPNSTIWRWAVTTLIVITIVSVGAYAQLSTQVARHDEALGHVQQELAEINLKLDKMIDRLIPRVP